MMGFLLNSWLMKISREVHMLAIDFFRQRGFFGNGA